MATHKDKFCLITRNAIDIFPIISQLAKELLEEPLDIRFQGYPKYDNGNTIEENLIKIRKLIEEIYMVSFCQVLKYRKLKEKKWKKREEEKLKKKEEEKACTNALIDLDERIEKYHNSKKEKTD